MVVVKLLRKSYIANKAGRLVVTRPLSHLRCWNPARILVILIGQLIGEQLTLLDCNRPKISCVILEQWKLSSQVPLRYAGHVYVLSQQPI